jgi:hypothetical protein
MQIPFSFIKSGADLMSGADGALSIDGTTVNIDAGDIKRYSSISIINSGILNIRGFSVYGSANTGYLPTIIGCSGNCTINTGGKIQAIDNAGLAADYYDTETYSAPVVPSDSAVNPISYSRSGTYGGDGGETGGYGTIPGTGAATTPYTGHGGGGAGSTDGGNATLTDDWGTSGAGGDSINGYPAGSTPEFSGFGVSGSTGFGGEVGNGVSVGGGASGGVRGISGGAIYLQIGGTASIDASTIFANGSAGGDGGIGGPASTTDDSSFGGGGGGGGAGGSGGYVWIRYKTGTVSGTAINITGGAGGFGGLGGIATGPSPLDGIVGSDGGNGSSGGSSVATY